jgi:hypothetical protein
MLEAQLTRHLFFSLASKLCSSLPPAGVVVMRVCGSPEQMDKGKFFDLRRESFVWQKLTNKQAVQKLTRLSPGRATDLPLNQD